MAMKYALVAKSGFKGAKIDQIYESINLDEQRIIMVARGMAERNMYIKSNLDRNTNYKKIMGFTLRDKPMSVIGKHFSEMSDTYKMTENLT